MIESFSLLVRLLRAIVGAWRRDPQFRTLVGLVFFTLLSGTIFYSVQEGWSVVDAFYFSVTTLTTVGLGDLAPTTTLGKLFTVVYIFAGLSLVLGFIDTLAKETFNSRTRGGGSGGGREDASGSKGREVRRKTLLLSPWTNKSLSEARRGQLSPRWAFRGQRWR